MVILFFWIRGKISGGLWKKQMIKWLYRRLLLAAVIEIFPVLKIIPATTILILMAHYHEKKIVKLFDLTLEELKRTSAINLAT